MIIQIIQRLFILSRLTFTPQRLLYLLHIPHIQTLSPFPNSSHPTLHHNTPLQLVTLPDTTPLFIPNQLTHFQTYTSSHHITFSPIFKLTPHCITSSFQVDDVTVALKQRDDAIEALRRMELLCRDKGVEWRSQMNQVEYLKHGVKHGSSPCLIYPMFVSLF